MIWVNQVGRWDRWVGRSGGLEDQVDRWVRKVGQVDRLGRFCLEKKCQVGYG